MEKHCGCVAENLATMEKAKKKAFSPSDIEKVCKVFQILSEPSRFKLVLALLNGGMCVRHLAEVSGGTISAVSHQLRVLRDNGIVVATRRGQNKEYALADEHIREMVEMGVEHLQCGDGK